MACEPREHEGHKARGVREPLKHVEHVAGEAREQVEHEADRAREHAGNVFSRLVSFIFTIMMW